MNIALYISGRSTLWDKWLVKQLKNNTDDKIDVFCSFNEPYKEDTKIMNEIKPVHINWEECIIPEEWLNVSYKHESTKPKNMCSMFYHNKRAFELIEKHATSNNIRYDLVVKFRPDIMNDFLPFFDHVSENELYTPKDHVFGWPGINDMIALGSFNTMKIYSSMYDHIDEYITKGILFHPETMLRHHIDSQGLISKTFEYKYELDKERFF